MRRVEYEDRVAQDIDVHNISWSALEPIGTGVPAKAYHRYCASVHKSAMDKTWEDLFRIYRRK